MRAWLVHPIGAMFVTLFSVPGSAFAQNDRDNAQILAEADAAFDRGLQNRKWLTQSRRDFSAATDHYLVLHRRGIRNPSLYLNLGNSATLADRWPEAIWAYHTGRKLDPNDDRLREQLAFVRRKVMSLPAGQGRLEHDPWPTWLHRPTLFAFFSVGITAYVLACLAGTIAYLRHSRWFTSVAIAIAIIALFAAVGGCREWRTALLDRETPLVIVAENIPLYRGNATSYPHHLTVPMLHRGMEVRQLHRRGDWLQVQLTTGEVGWLPRSSALIVEP